jgi:hypothetical protein
MGIIILPENVELTEEVRTLYKDKNGKYYLSRETAEAKLATHFHCKCGNGIRQTHRIYCDACEPKQIIPSKDWDGKSMLYVEDFGKFFSDVQEIEEYCHEQIEDGEDVDKHALTIFICEGNYYNTIPEDYWSDIQETEDGYVSFPKTIKQKLDELNQAIVDYKEPATWSVSKYRANIEWSED